MLVSVRGSNYIVLLFITLGLAACQFRSDEYVNFADLEAAKGLKFQVIGQKETDLSEGLPSNCYLPDGTPVYEYVDEEESGEQDGPDGVNKAPKTNSVTGAAILQELLKYGNQNKVLEIVGTYPSYDAEWN